MSGGDDAWLDDGIWSGQVTSTSAVRHTRLTTGGRPDEVIDPSDRQLKHSLLLTF